MQGSRAWPASHNIHATRNHTQIMPTKNREKEVDILRWCTPTAPAFCFIILLDYYCGWYDKGIITHLHKTGLRG